MYFGLISSRGSGSDVPDHSFARPGRPAGDMILWLLLATLGVGFAACFVLYFVLRTSGKATPPPDVIRLPAGIWLSTGLMLCSSGAIHAARWYASRGFRRPLVWAVIVALLLGGAFLWSQYAIWLQLFDAGIWRSTGGAAQMNLFHGMFFIFSGFHFAHVIGGLVALSVVLGRALARRYSRVNFAGVSRAAIYWHFVDGVWLAVVLVLLIA